MGPAQHQVHPQVGQQHLSSRDGVRHTYHPPSAASGPYKVLRKGPKVFHIEVGGMEQIVTVDRLKPHSGAATADPAAPPKRGRPPAARAVPTAQATPAEGGEQRGPGQQAAARDQEPTPAEAAPAAPTAPPGGQRAVLRSPSNYKCQAGKREA